VRDERRLHETEIANVELDVWSDCMDRIRNKYIRGSLKVAPVFEIMRSNRLAWYGHVTQRDESHITKRVMTMNIDGHPSRGRPRKRWMDCVKDDMKLKGVSMDMTSDRREWKKKHVVSTPHGGIRRR
jgi:hypothetical protein